MSDYQFNPNVEQWKEIPEFPGYEASDHGKIRSYWKQSGKIGGGGKWFLSDNPQRILKPGKARRNPYPIVILQKNHKRICMKVHRLILLAFIGPCPEGMEGCHKDGNRQNPRLDNLRWDTRAGNNIDRYRHGHYETQPKGEAHPNSKLKKEDIIQIRKMIIQGISLADIGRSLDVSTSNICAISKGRTWRHVP